MSVVEDIRAPMIVLIKMVFYLYGHVRNGIDALLYNLERKEPFNKSDYHHM